MESVDFPYTLAHWASSRSRRRICHTSPFGRTMPAVSASQRRAAGATRVLRTTLRSKVERLITWSTSPVALSCSRASLSSRVSISTFFSRSMWVSTAPLRSLGLAFVILAHRRSEPSSVMNSSDLVITGGSGRHQLLPERYHNPVWQSEVMERSEGREKPIRNRPAQATNKAHFNRVGAARENNGNRCGRRLRSQAPRRDCRLQRERRPGG